MHLLPTLLSTVLNIFAAFVSLLILIALITAIVLYVVDRRQHKDAIRHNFPVVGRFRALFSHLGEFFRQYFFAMDREEMPFNRAERTWVDHASKAEGNTMAFGSTKNLNLPGTALFVNAPFAKLEKEIDEPEPLLIGPYVENPYVPPSYFNISGMSYGAISRPAVLALSRGAKMAKCWMNTGEGGLSPYHLEGGADIVFQMGTAKNGCRNDDSTLNEDKLKKITDNAQVKMVEIKLAQGAKPGKGGLLPGGKVTPEIAEIRGLKVGQPSHAPNRHPEISNTGELLDFISRVRSIAKKPVGFKTVIGSSAWVEELCREINHRGIEHAPDFITIDSADGGTGAAPMPLMDNVGLRISEALPIVDHVLRKHDLRDRIRIIVSGKRIIPSAVALVLCSGADFVVTARGFMFALGCIQAMRCNKNTCPTGITTHNKALQTGLDPTEKSHRVAAYCHSVRMEVDMIAHACGVDAARQLSREHVRIVQESGHSVSLEELYPQTPS
ncbi:MULTISPECIES: FMN-binding glutamate synthase family protein [unclassified Pseudovibrio]|uniref:FMN-binding glutamate synthase family protein n=1 Tax=unclassified Pseudovibrio TaxID=2627060 RepID=UPI0007AEBA15|nr:MULTISPECIES: FMN-binding glutamate synthase family protein [unclassified Pseudovibrio]KZL16401.1 Glutamate synthase [NADPH] large chain [Pseudovibrio sp. Ad26]KZL27987.1 Glutamate synthase [NADPH] large chain [Pseudovibrio sp. WM33]